MDDVKNEMVELGRALVDPVYADRRDELYAAQQALAWVIDPQIAMRPTDHLLAHYNAAAGTGCSGHTRQVMS